jgi:hypothetical protein
LLIRLSVGVMVFSPSPASLGAGGVFATITAHCIIDTQSSILQVFFFIPLQKTKRCGKCIDERAAAG